MTKWKVLVFYWEYIYYSPRRQKLLRILLFDDTAGADGDEGDEDGQPQDPAMLPDSPTGASRGDILNGVIIGTKPNKKNAF